MTLTFTAGEYDRLTEMRRVGGFRSDEDTVYGALFWYARFLDVEVSADLFALVRPTTRLINQMDLFEAEA